MNKVMNNNLNQIKGKKMENETHLYKGASDVGNTPRHRIQYIIILNGDGPSTLPPT